MNTLAVMCIALTRQSPSFTPLARTSSSIRLVMFTNSMRSLVWRVRCFVWDFIGYPVARLPSCPAGKPGNRVTGQPSFQLRQLRAILEHVREQIADFRDTRGHGLQV